MLQNYIYGTIDGFTWIHDEKPNFNQDWKKQINKRIEDFSSAFGKYENATTLFVFFFSNFLRPVFFCFYFNLIFMFRLCMFSRMFFLMFLSFVAFDTNNLFLCM